MPPPNTLNILILAGGTGGHIIPGIALAKELTSRLAHTPSEIRILSSLRNKDFPDFADPTLKIDFYDPPKIPKNPLYFPIFFLRLLRAYKKAKEIIKIFSIDAVVGMGGYTSLPALLAARRLHRPYSLCDQNAIPGRATRLFAKGAKRIYLGVPVSSTRIPKEKCLLVGNPIKPSLLAFLQSPKEKNSKADTQAKGPPHKSPSKNFEILVLGGSQGALQLNRMCTEIIQKAWLPDANWQIQCGKAHLSAMQGLLPKTDFPNVELFGYHPAIADLLARADALVCRAGAGILSEGVLFGLPMILVPYPYAQDKHQLANARYYEKEGAAFVIASKEIESKLLYEKLKELKENPKLRENMRKKSKALARPDAAQKIAEDLLRDLAVQKYNLN